MWYIRWIACLWRKDMIYGTAKSTVLRSVFTVSKKNITCKEYNYHLSTVHSKMKRLSTKQTCCIYPTYMFVFISVNFIAYPPPHHHHHHHPSKNDSMMPYRVMFFSVVCAMMSRSYIDIPRVLFSKWQTVLGIRYISDWYRFTWCYSKNLTCCFSIIHIGWVCWRPIVSENVCLKHNRESFIFWGKT